MVLSDREIRKRIKEGKLVVRPFDDDCVQPSSIDLHLGDEFLASDSHYLNQRGVVGANTRSIWGKK